MLSVNPFAKKKSGKLGNLTWEYLFWCSLYFSVDVDEQKYLLFLLLSPLSSLFTSCEKCSFDLWGKIVQQGEERGYFAAIKLLCSLRSGRAELPVIS